MSDKPRTPSALYPGLSYDDAVAAMDWLERVFGFKRRLVVPGPDNTVIHSELSLGDAVVMLGTARPESGRVSPLKINGVTAALSVWVPDVDAHYSHAVKEGIELIEDLHDSAFGARMYLARDVEGHCWCFSDYRPGEHWDAES